MRVLRFDSVGGASGDMLLGALIGLGANVDVLNRELASLLPDEKFSIITAAKQSHGINDGIQANVVIDNHHRHHHHEDDHGHGRNFKVIRELIEASALPEEVKKISIAVFAALAEAEGKVHNKPIDEVHFHEVGAVDSIVDIVGYCLACHLLEIDGISVSPLPTGSGTFTCRHGTYPLPAPATLEMLKRGLPSAPTDEPFELVTPTGAALLAIWPKAEISSDAAVTCSANSFGQRELKNRPNLLRATIYETVSGTQSHDLTVLETNIDDCSPEIIGIVFDKLLAAGARDVWTTPVMMKKQRNGILLSALCDPAEKDKFIDLVLSETTTFGIREYQVRRHCLDRHFEEVITPYGKVRIKVGSHKGREITRSPEMDDCRKLAEQHNISVKEILKSL